MKQDVLDSLEAITSTHLVLALDSKFPISVKLAECILPRTVTKFHHLTRKCTTASTIFNLFTIEKGVIFCKFPFFDPFQTLPITSFTSSLSDFTQIQQKLNKLSFYYTIPFPNLSFTIPSSSVKFVYNSSYDEFVTDRSQNFEGFMDQNPLLFQPLVP